MKGSISNNYAMWRHNFEIIPLGRSKGCRYGVAYYKSPLLTGHIALYNEWDFVRHVHHWTDIDLHSDLENPE